MRRIIEWKHRIRNEWNPREIEKPEIDPDLPKLTALQRSAEVIRYWINGIEYWVSPNGLIREWFRWNLWAAFVIGIPAFLVVPIVTFLFSQFDLWSLLFMKIVVNLIMFPIMLLLALAVLSAIYFLIRPYLPERFQRRRHRYPEDY